MSLTLIGRLYNVFLEFKIDITTNTLTFNLKYSLQSVILVHTLSYLIRRLPFHRESIRQRWRSNLCEPAWITGTTQIPLLVFSGRETLTDRI